MLKKNSTELGKTISKARENVGISQRELARQANMDCAEVSRIESGKRLKPNVLYLKGIADTLNLSMVDLMKMAGYDDVEINWGRDFTDKRSIADYQKQIEIYEKFYFDVLEDIDERRKNAFACKGIIADIIDKIELAKIEKKEISNDEILERLKEFIPMIRPNLEKFDKKKYPNIDTCLLPKTKLPTPKPNFNTVTGKFIKNDK